MSLSYAPLTIEDDGRVYLDATGEDDRPECLGHIDDGCPDPDLSRQWDWLAQEHRDSQRFAAGCRLAAASAWSDRFGDPSRW